MPLEITQEYKRLGKHGSHCYRARLGPIDVICPTKAEARDALMKVVEGALSGEWTPALFLYGIQYALVYRNPHGWAFQFGNIANGCRFDVSIGLGDINRDDAIRSTKMHLAQSAWPALNGLDLLAGDHDAILDHLHWIGFQRAYIAAIEGQEDVDDHKAHTYACRHADEDDFLMADELIARDAARLAMRPF